VTCENCEKDSPIYDVKLDCCKLRMLAHAPRHAQAEHGKSLTQAERDELRPKLIAEIQRLKK
jgi:hypothetical protein